MPDERPDTPEMDMALSLSHAIGALSAHELPCDDMKQALWRWRRARGMDQWEGTNGTPAPNDGPVEDAEVVA